MSSIRLLTDDVTRRIIYFYSKPFYTNFGFMFTLAFGLPLIGVVSAIGGWMALAALGALWFFLLFHFLYGIKLSKVKKAKEVYEFGPEEMIYFEGIGYNYGIKVNGAPQPVVSIRKNGETIRIKTFARQVIAAFEVAAQKAYVMDKYPEIILPETLFTMNIDGKQQKTRSINI